MATIDKRVYPNGSVKYRVRARLKGFPGVSWRKGYDDFEPARIKLGARGHGVFRDVEDGNDVTAWHDFESIEAAKAFVNSFELKAAMQAAGVVVAPAIWFTHHALP
jgi:hypothetical protein